MRVVVSGGGTGGHFFPALELLREARGRGLETLYVGARRGIERRLEDLIPSERVFLDLHPLRGVSPGKRVRSLWSFLKGFLLLRRTLSGDFRSVVFGGYVSVPLGAVTLTRRRPLYLHEQNSVPSATNRLFYPGARRVFITFEYTRKFFRGDRVIRTGLPVRRELLRTRMERGKAKELLGFDPSRPLLLFMGGSQGAMFINTLALEVARRMEVQALVLSGERDYPRVREVSEGLEGVKVFPFRTDMGVVYSATDVAVVRSGSSTLTELSLFGVPALMIPYPYAAGDHQYYNAKEIEDLGGGAVLRQEEATPGRVSRLLERILENRGEMSRSIRRFANPEASRVILEEVLK
jgi:UDP-N-acetylglucosamine--N-acetylmuramyl-(pentapeptide) pyrophosphoryl-undecaprenol N-acetylglucosamine transferase